ncbi:hypothetical protein [Sphingomicrobium nitratireducens]|uniref:hypothetical protein n=1 Tax=Sphingomicrobium nitratireducens TaxID=2964666 RepID=UPI00223F7249|nr:hypothetical protein [Sphingomicrobium nitratireducens]
MPKKTNRFIIKEGDTYYVTTKLLVYDQKAAGGDPDKIAGYDKIKDAYNQGNKESAEAEAGAFEVREVSDAKVLGPINTGDWP